jgi:hypothetical protein
MNAVVRALGVGTHTPPAPDRPSPDTARPGRPHRSPRCPLREDHRVDGPHGTACSAFGEEVDMIEAERARVPIARARGPVAGWRKEPA